MVGGGGVRGRGKFQAGRNSPSPPLDRKSCAKSSPGWLRGRYLIPLEVISRAEITDSV